MFGIAAMAVLRTHLGGETRDLQSACWRKFLQQNSTEQVQVWRRQVVAPDVGLGDISNMPFMPPLLGLCLSCSLARNAFSPQPHSSPSHFTQTLPQMSLLQECLRDRRTPSSTLHPTLLDISFSTRWHQGRKKNLTSTLLGLVTKDRLVRGKQTEVY